MTDRQRFEGRAIECGATILDATNMRLVVLATDGHMVTTYTFTEDGSFRGITTTYRES